MASPTRPIAPEAPGASREPDLNRRLGVFPATNIVVANMIGAGIFTTSGLLMDQLGDAAAGRTRRRKVRLEMRHERRTAPGTRSGRSTAVRRLAPALLACAALVVAPSPGAAQARQDSLDARVRRLLDGRRWRDMNVPARDGQVLHDLIVQHRFTRALEVGTSTGHSAIWMAWALSKTGGRLVTIEIDEGRHREALRNFREAGVADYIDARLADAHQLVPALPGPFDFAFLDADKDWNLRYFQAILAKLAPGGCIATHNISRRRWAGDGGYLAEVERTPGLTTELVGTSIALSCRRAGP